MKQVYCYSKYLGFLKLKFDKNGELLKPVDGKGVYFAYPMLLHNGVPESQVVLDAMQPYKENMTDYYKVIGSTKVFLATSTKGECNLGDIVADAFASGPWEGIGETLTITEEWLPSTGFCCRLCLCQ